MNRISTSIQTLISISLWSLQINAVSVCHKGWFGTDCKYSCHCVDMCTDRDECPRNKCNPGWFGLGCQNRDLLLEANITITSIPPSETDSLRWLTDNDDTTCNLNSDLKSLAVTWYKTYVFSWLRYTVKEDVDEPDINLTCYGWDGAALVDATCVNTQIIRIDSRTFEIHCDASSSFKKWLVEGEDVRNLCNLYINGGRNLATGSDILTSTTLFGRENGYKAVDGITSSDFADDSCTHTSPQDPNPTLTLELPHSYLITRYVLYNRNGPDGSRLKGFKITSFDANGNEVFSYTDDANSPHKFTYDVLDQLGWKKSIQKIVVSQENVVEGKFPILTICELQTYGDCPFGTWSLQCERCSRNCYNGSCLRDNGLCHKGCLGFSDPPVCTQPCETGVWGLNCAVPCLSNHCLNNSCDKETGICDLGCAPKYINNPDCSIACPENCLEEVCTVKDLECTKGCIPSWYGPQCTNACSPNCAGKVCDREGKCTKGCKARFAGAVCETVVVEESSGSGIYVVLLVLMLVGGLIGVMALPRRMLKKAVLQEDPVNQIGKLTPGIN